MHLQEAELDIWRYTLNEQDYYDEKDFPILSQQETMRCHEFVHEAQKIRYICNHRFVRKVLAKYLNISAPGIKFSYQERGKPFIENFPLFFNYSYRADFGLLAISTKQEVGVDIEKIKDLREPAIFSSFSFSEREKELIFAAGTHGFNDTLFTFWTFKEAIIKALGVGLNADLTQIDLADFLYSPLNPLVFDNSNYYTIKKIAAAEGYKAAFAIKGKVTAVKEYNFLTD